MLSSLRPVHPSKLCRIVYVVCVLTAISYILFDVLDLDGSNFSRLMAPMERSITVAEAPSATELVGSSELATRRVNIQHTRPTDRFEGLNFSSQTRTFGFSGVDSARSHRYRVDLSRDSIADASPDH
jgi:hypothetical protein